MPKAGRAALADIIRQARDPESSALSPDELAERLWPAFRVAVAGVLNDLRADELSQKDGASPTYRSRPRAGR